MSTIFRQLMGTTVVVACMCGPAAVWGSVVVGGTRVIYPGGAREVTVKLSNVGNDPSLVQAWTDRGDASVSADKVDVPFIVMPPIFRIDPANAQTLRITYTHEPLPQDRESVFWLNVLDLPPSPAAQGNGDTNFMQVAIRTRIKIIFRPENLPGDLIGAAEHLAWQVVPVASGLGYALRGTNASAYTVSFNRVGVSDGDKVFNGNGGMILPGGTTDFPLEGLSTRPSVTARVRYQWINDYGAGQNLDVPLGQNAP